MKGYFMGKMSWFLFLFPFVEPWVGKCICGNQSTWGSWAGKRSNFIFCKMNNFEVFSILQTKKVRWPNLLKDLWISVSLNEWKDPDNFETNKRGSVLLKELSLGYERKNIFSLFKIIHFLHSCQHAFFFFFNYSC